MPDNGSIQKRDAHEMTHGRPVQITERTTVTELQPSLSDVVCANKKLQIGFIVALVVLALLSGFVARPHFADTKTWDSTIEVIDQKKGNVLALTTSCVALSAGITALPGDTGTPVAEQLAQLSGNLGIVLAVLYLEKYLLTILWSVGLGILIPFALALFAVSLGVHGCWSTSAVLRRVATRVLVVAVIGMALVPASVWVSQKVDETYRVSIEQAEQKAEDAAKKTDTAEKSTETSSKSSKKKSETTESKKRARATDRWGIEPGYVGDQRRQADDRRDRAAGDRPHRRRHRDDRDLVCDSSTGARGVPMARTRAAGDRCLRSRELSDGSFLERSVQTCQEEWAV